MKYELYTDASLPNDTSLNIAGLGSVIVDEYNSLVTDSSFKTSCNDIQVAELSSIINCMILLNKLDNRSNKSVIIYCDNLSVVDYINGKSLTNDNREYSTKSIKNKIELGKLLHQYNSITSKSYVKSIDVYHTKGHRKGYNKSSIYNSLADVLCRDGIRKYLELSRSKSNFQGKFKANSR